jgi:predicted Zn finger-like uncharacterized protein
MKIQCPHCRKKYALDDHLEGKRAKCKDCATVFSVVASEPEEEPELPPLPEEREDEEGFEEVARPRPRKPRRWLPVVAACLAIVLLGSAGLFFTLRNVRPELFPGILTSSEDELMAFVAADTESLILIDIEEISQIPEIQSLTDRAIQARKEKVPLGLGKRRLALSPRKASDKENETLSIFSLEQPFKVQPLLDAGHARQKEKDGLTYFEIAADNIWIAHPSPKIVLRSHSEVKLVEALEAVRKKTPISDELRQAFRATSGPVRMASIGPAAQSVVPSSPFALLFKDDVDAPPLCLSQSISTSLQSDRIEARIVSRYSDEVKAKTASEILTKGIKKAIALMAGEKQGGEVYLMRVVLDSLKIEPKGSELVLRLDVPLKELKRLRP